MAPIVDPEFDALVRRDYEGMCRYVWRIVRNPDDAVDIVQETFLRFYRLRARQAVCRMDQASVLLYRMARNLAIDCVRRRAAVKRYTEFHPNLLRMSTPHSAEQEMLAEELFAQLDEALQGLQPREIECLALKQEGRSYEEIALILDIRAGSVGPTITRAVRKLRAALQLSSPKAPAEDSVNSALRGKKRARNLLKTGKQGSHLLLAMGGRVHE